MHGLHLGWSWDGSYVIIGHEYAMIWELVTRRHVDNLIKVPFPLFFKLMISLSVKGIIQKKLANNGVSQKTGRC